MVRKDCFPDAILDEEFPFPVQMRMGCCLDEEFQVLQKLEPLVPLQLVLLAQQVPQVPGLRFLK
jgi:hypothetical protein